MRALASQLGSFKFCLPRRLLALFAGLLAANATFHVALAAPSIYTAVSTNTPWTETDQAGVVLSSSSTMQNYQLGVVNGSASDSTSMGINRIAAVGEFRQDFNDGQGFVSVNAGATSYWRDDWTVVGGTGDITLTVHGEIRFDLIGTPGVLGHLEFNHLMIRASLDSPGGVFLLADQSSFVSMLGGTLVWSRTFNVQADSTFQMSEQFNIYIASNTMFNLGPFADHFESIAFDAMHTSVLTHVDVPDGVILSSASGELIAHDGGYGYAAVIAASVPEPGAWALLLAGGGLLGLRRRCRPATV